MGEFINFRPEAVLETLFRIKAQQDGEENVEIIVREVKNEPQKEEEAS